MRCSARRSPPPRTGTRWSAAASSSIPRSGGRTRPGLEARRHLPDPRGGQRRPQVFALWPHAAGLLLRAPAAHHAARTGALPSRAGSPAMAAHHQHAVHTGLAGWTEGNAVLLDQVASNAPSLRRHRRVRQLQPNRSREPKRLLVSAIARIEPTGFRWADNWKRDVADPGRPPLLQEPVEARIRWRHRGKRKSKPSRSTTPARASARCQSVKSKTASI